MSKAEKNRAKLFSPEYLFYDFNKVTMALPGLLLFRPKIYYESKNARKRIRGGAIVIANHIGYFDPMYLMYVIWYRRHRFVCMAEFFRSKARWIFEHFLCIPVERDNFSVDSFRQITQHLKGGHIVSMFPEGRIGDREGDYLQAFKSGMVLMALKSRTPIVNVYIKKREHWYSRLEAVVGDPVDVYKMYGDRPSFAQMEEVTGLLYEKEKKLAKMNKK